MKTGLVLEGGGFRGIYTAGVLDAFMDAGIAFDGLIGVSAGAIHGCSFLSGQRGRSIRYYRKYMSDPRFMSLRSWITTGDIVGSDFCYHELPEKLDIYDYDAFERNHVPFYVVCTDVETGKPAYIRLNDMRGQIDCVRASASLPYFSRIVRIDGHGYLDGGCADSIPVEAFMRMGFERNVVVLTRDAAYRKKPEMRAMARVLYRKYPALVETLENRHNAYNATVKRVAELEKQGSAFVIRPEKPLDVDRMEKDPEKVQRAYDMGYADAERRIDALRIWLKQGTGDG